MVHKQTNSYMYIQKQMVTRWSITLVEYRFFHVFPSKQNKNQLFQLPIPLHVLVLLKSSSQLHFFCTEIATKHTRTHTHTHMHTHTHIHTHTHTHTHTHACIHTHTHTHAHTHNTYTPFTCRTSDTNRWRL